MDNMINGYSYEKVRKAVFDEYKNLTHRFFREQEGLLEKRIASFQGRLYLSLGENCGPGVKIRSGSSRTLGGSYFDNIVCPISSLELLLKTDFANILNIHHLEVRSWESNDSVFDTYHKIFYHHDFYLGGEEKRRSDPSSNAIRCIEETDVPLFYAAVKAKFEYLAQKFRRLSRDPSLPKTYVVRLVNGWSLGSSAVDNIEHSLRVFGATNYKVICVHSDKEEADSRHLLIPEVGVRWGEDSLWRVVFSD